MAKFVVVSQTVNPFKRNAAYRTHYNKVTAENDLQALNKFFSNDKWKNRKLVEVRSA
jgi:hypothetical protein